MKMFTDWLHRNLTRREFLQQGLRGLALGGLLALSGRLLSRRQLRLTAEECTNRGVCRDCPVLPSCELPNATSFRERDGDSQSAAASHTSH